MIMKLSGNHPLIQEHNNLLKQLYALSDNIGREKDKARKELPRPEYKIIDVLPYQHKFKDPNVLVWTFTLELQNYNAYADYKDVWGSHPDVQKIIPSVGYYRHESGLLLHTGGGHSIFGSIENGHITISEEDWDSLLNKKVPESLKKRTNYYTFVD